MPLTVKAVDNFEKCTIGIDTNGLACDKDTVEKNDYINISVPEHKTTFLQDRTYETFAIIGVDMTYDIQANVTLKRADFVEAQDYKFTGTKTLSINKVASANGRYLNNFIVRYHNSENNVIISDDKGEFVFKDYADFLNQYPTFQTKYNLPNLTTDKSDIVLGENDKFIFDGVPNANFVKQYITTDMDITYTDTAITFSPKQTATKKEFKDNDVTFVSDKGLDSNYTLKVLAKTYENTNKQDFDVAGYKFLNAYDISIMNDDEVITMENGNFTIALPMKEKYDAYKVAYIKDNKVMEVLPATYKDGYITFKTTHLSEYAAYGTMFVDNEETITEEKEPNPQTGDNITMIVSTLVIATFILAIISYNLYHKNKKEM